jgi:type I restriction enzyme M protein
LGFEPKENTSNIFIKKYSSGYPIEVDCAKSQISYGDKIKAESKTTQNFSMPENFVVLECVNRLLEKGYQPENIVLEKTWKLGRQEKGRLDILVNKENSAYLMLECKTYGEEFDKELKDIQNTGGQIFSYFQQDTKAELLMLYTSKLSGNDIVSDFRIIKIEEKFRNAGNVKEVHKLWNGKFYEMNFWGNLPYDTESKIFTKKQLKELTEDEGKKLFHGFATILRKHSVSDKPNAFNVIFNLFLAKLYDEQKRDEDELEFQWKENDNPVDFQIRLYNLHKEGLFDFLKKEIEGIKEEE